MKFPAALTVRSIAKEFDCALKGDDTLSLIGISEIHNVDEGDLIFVDHPKYYDKALRSKASAIIINKEVEVSVLLPAEIIEFRDDESTDN